MAALFTDAQWGDVQSFLNFVVLLALTYYGRKAKKEIPQAAAEATQAQLINGHYSEDNDAPDFFETLLDAMEERRAKNAPGGNERRHGI